MRNLWTFLQRNAFLLAFLFLMAVSLGVLVRNDGSARSSWFRTTGAVAAGVEGQQRRWQDYLELAEQNQRLADENAQLREQLLARDATADATEDTLRGWAVKTGTLIKGPDGKPRTMAVGQPGSNAGIVPGMGVIAHGMAFGTVLDAGVDHVRILPILNTGGTWSCRLGQTGTVAPLTWDGRDPQSLTLNDVPRYAEIQPGDTVFTSGFDLRFPADVPVGIVTAYEAAGGSDFRAVQVAPILDPASVRHLEFVRHRADSERTVLAQPLPVP